MRCVPNSGVDMLGDLLPGKDTKNDWAGLSLYEERNNCKCDPAQKVHDIISRCPLDIPRSQQKPDINSRICRMLRLTGPSPVNARASPRPQRRPPRAKDTPNIQVDLHLCRTNRRDSMRSLRRDLYIELFLPGARYDAATPILPNIPLEARLFERCLFERHSPAPNCLVTRRGCRAVPQTGCRENAHGVDEVITLTSRQR